VGKLGEMGSSANGAFAPRKSPEKTDIRADRSFAITKLQAQTSPAPLPAKATFN
jgi:hypothetical protein